MDGAPAPRGKGVQAALALGTLAAVCLAVVAPDAAEPHERTHLPKELALALGAALSLAVLLWRTRARPQLDVLDAAAIGVAVLGVPCALAAVDADTGLRLAAITAGGAALFVCARNTDADARDTGRDAWLARGLAIVLALSAALVLVEALVGVRLAPAGSGPGGLLGQRNNAAHVLALGAPFLGAGAARGRAGDRALAWMALALVVGAVIVTRSRVGWWALGAGCVGTFVVLALRRDARALVTVTLAVLAGGVVLLAPPALHWRSRTPYTDTLGALIDVDSGSGRGRVMQARTSLALLGAAPLGAQLFGLGPGHWAVHYPRAAAPSDPTVHRDSLRPVNRLVTSDFVALVVERGALGGVAWIACAVLAWRARRRELVWVGPTSMALAVLMAGDCVVQIATGAALVSVLAARALPRAAVIGAPARASALVGAALVGVLALVVVHGAWRAADRLAAQQALVAARSLDDVARVARAHPHALAPRFVLIESAQARADCAALTPWLDEALALRPHVPRLQQARAACPPQP